METSRKKRVMIHSDFPLALTGFGKHCRNIMEYLHATNKYELCNLAVGSMANAPDLTRTPWKTMGTVEPQKIEALRSQNDPKNWDGILRMAGYGQFIIQDAVKEFKPDVLFSIQDIWGIDFCLQAPWFDKITCVQWTTLDSLPILDKAILAAKKSKNFWSWAEFATKALHDVNHKHVKTVRGSLNVKNFFKLDNSKRLSLREKFGISPDTFVIGFVFRNQLRKSVPNLIKGFKLFRQNNPTTKTKLLLHTHWNEGWNIKKLCEEHQVPLSDILTTYVCRGCRKYEIKNFSNNEVDCKFCNGKNTQITTGPGFGVSEEQLNEVYNLMDCYAHPFTSGGMEIPCFEAKLVELVTLVTNYSCGEDLCEDPAGSLPLEWNEYREPDTMFIKASTNPNSICKQLTKVLNMKPETKKEFGKKGRQWVIDNFSIEVIGKFLEEFIDNAPAITDESIFEPIKINPNPYYVMPANILDDSQWITHLYHNILDRKEIDAIDEGHKHWMGRINKELSREHIEKYFREVAFKTLQEQKAGGVKFEDLLNPNDKGRVLVVINGDDKDVFNATSIFESIKSRYPDWKLYVSTHAQYGPILDGNLLVDKWIPHNPILENYIFTEGNNQSKGFFNVCYNLPCQPTPHNDLDKIDSNLITTTPPLGSINYSSTQIEKSLEDPSVRIFPYIPQIQMTGIPPKISDLRKNGTAGLGTIGYFYDDSGNLINASKINSFL